MHVIIGCSGLMSLLEYTVSSEEMSTPWIDGQCIT